MSGEHLHRSYSTTIGCYYGFVASPSPSLEASANEDGDDEDDASSSGDDEMTTSW